MKQFAADFAAGLVAVAADGPMSFLWLIASLLIASLWLIALLLFVVGMFSPKAVIRWGERRTRRQVFLVYGSGVAFTWGLSLILNALSPLTEERVKALAAKMASARRSQESTTQAGVEQRSEAKPNLEVIEHHLSWDGHIGGTVRNNSSKTYRYVQVSINLYDPSGAQVGSTMANVNNLEPHNDWKFRALVTNYFDRYQIKDVTGW